MVLGDRCHGTHGEIDGLNCLFDVERPRFSILIDAIPVVNAKGRITCLLDFSDKQTGTNCVNRAGRDEDAIACSHLETMQGFSNPPPLDCGLEIGVRYSLSQARVNFCTRLRVDDIPDRPRKKKNRSRNSGREAERKWRPFPRK